MAGSPRDAEVGQGRADTSQLSPNPLFPRDWSYGEGGGKNPTAPPPCPPHLALSIPTAEAPRAARLRPCPEAGIWGADSARIFLS